MRVFISHTTKDDPVVTKIRKGLKSLGIDAWVDSQELIAGDKLTPEVQKSIKNSEHFIAVLSQNAADSAWVAKEINYRRRLKKM